MPDATTTDLASWLLEQIAEDEAVYRAPEWWETELATRMLAECDAKRRIVELHGPVDRYDTDSCRECSDSGWAGCVDGHSRVVLPCPTLRLLALPYSDRPGYRPEWRP